MFPFNMLAQTMWSYLILNVILGLLNSAKCLGTTVTPVDYQDGPLILTPYIENGETKKAKELSAVDPTLFAGVSSHAAYFTVDKIRKWNLFFWYFPAQGVPVESTPLVIWLQGGPGASSLYGLFGEIGPLQAVNGTVLKMPVTWGSDYSLLFIDNPVGTGFSFTEKKEYVTEEHTVGRCLLSFIQQFLQVFSELRTAPLFIAGESYAGKYIPAFGHYIHHNKNDSMPINLRGLAISGGWIDPPTMLHYSEWALQLGLIDHGEAIFIHKLEAEARKNWIQGNFLAYKENAAKAFTMLTIFAPVNVYNYLNGENKEYPSSIDISMETLLNKPEIQKALHVKKKDFFTINTIVYDWLQSDEYRNVKLWLEELLEHYGVLCYNGQLDMVVPYALSVRTYRSLKWSGRNAYLAAQRSLLYDEEKDSQINSFVKASGNFMEAMVRGAGHMLSTDKPRAAKQIIDMFINKFK